MKVVDLIEMYRSLSLAKNKVANELRDRLEWEDLYRLGLTIEAIRKYRDTSNPPVTLIEAKKAIDKYFNGRNFI